MPKVSVVIPCYNQGHYLDTAIDSVLAQSMQDFEIIVVNDGSTDEFTNRLLSSYQRPRTKVLQTQNCGLASARNNAIREAAGEFILPLDADDKIAPTYLEKALQVIESHPDTRIVYCKAETFGAVTGSWLAEPFTLRRMLLGNLIFCTALYRRSDWETVGGYNSNMAHGWEDWDFWLSLLELGGQVHRIDEVLFYYYVKEGSMAKSMDSKKRVDMHMQVMLNHKNLYIQNARPLLDLYYLVTGSAPYRLMKRLRIPYLASSLLRRK